MPDILGQGTITDPRGFLAGATYAGIKTPGPGKLDLGLLYSEAPCVAAGVFTTNRVKAAPVVLSQERLRGGRAQAILVNAGNANACTGPEGLEDARESARGAAALLKIPERLVLPASTGVIGQPLPLAKIKQALPKLTARLNPKGFPEAAQAILTTDTRPKTALLRETIGGKVGGVAVAIGARVGAKAGASEVLVSQTVKDLTVGSGLIFEDRGQHELKGIPDLWHLYRVLA